MPLASSSHLIAGVAAYGALAFPTPPLPVALLPVAWHRPDQPPQAPCPAPQEEGRFRSPISRVATLLPEKRTTSLASHPLPLAPGGPAPQRQKDERLPKSAFEARQRNAVGCFSHSRFCPATPRSARRETYNSDAQVRGHEPKTALPNPSIQSPKEPLRSRRLPFGGGSGDPHSASVPPRKSFCAGSIGRSNAIAGAHSIQRSGDACSLVMRQALLQSDCLLQRLQDVFDDVIVENPAS